MTFILLLKHCSDWLLLRPEGQKRCRLRISSGSRVRSLDEVLVLFFHVSSTVFLGSGLDRPPLRPSNELTDDPSKLARFSQGWRLSDLLSTARVQRGSFRFFILLLRGVAKAALHCAHRTSTFLSCAFCEHEGHLAAPLRLLFV